MAKEERNVKKSGAVKYVFVAVLLSALINVAGLFIYHNYFAVKIVAFDLKGYIWGLRDMYINGKINDEQLKQSIDMAEKAVTTLSKNKVVLLGDVVLTKHVEKIDYPIKIDIPQSPLSEFKKEMEKENKEDKSNKESK
ncbi:MAG: hypothetical protein QXV73_04245 [Candidatus Micrarchaeia archaeon]